MFSSASRSAARSRLSNLDLPSRHRSTSIGGHLHSRDSFGYGVHSRRSSSEDRKSGSSSARRFSGIRTSSGNEVKGVIKETRPLTDKAYQKKKTLECVEFLEEHGFKPTITHARLMQPSRKDFEMIFQFLVNFLEPSFKVKNLEDDALRILKNFGYPFIPNKSAFTYVARTNFSSLLGVLLFLMDLAKFSMRIDMSNLLASGDSDNPQEHAVLLQYIFECYSKGINDEKEEYSVFQQIIRSRYSYDDHKLKNLAIKEKLEKVQVELAAVETLQKKSQSSDSAIQSYDEYFLKMATHKEQKEATISKILEDLNGKMTLLNELEEKLKEKQSIYDAQGFDGKKQLSHYETQKKEFTESLQEKKAILKDLQNECWNLEMQHTQLLDKGSELCEKFNQMHAQIKDIAQVISHSLQEMEGPTVQSIKNFNLDIPDCQMQFNQKFLSTWNNTNKVALEDIQKKVSKANILLKIVTSTVSQELTEIEMKKLQLSTKLKCVSSAETKKEQDFLNLEKQAIEEVKTLKNKCDEELGKLDKLHKELAEKEDHFNKLNADLQEVIKLKISKQTMLEEYLQELKKFLEQISLNEVASLDEAKECREEISSVLNQLLNNYK